MNHALARRALAEFVGTAFLVAAVIGSGIAAVRLSPNDVGLELLENSVITGGALLALILALQPVSAAFNPIVTLVERALGAVSNRDAAALIAAQVAGGLLGAVVANLMFGLSAVNLSTHHRDGGGVLLGEVVATLGLLVVIFGTVRAARSDRVAFAVGAYILAAYWFTSSTSFANPAVTIARMFSNTFAGIAPASVAPFILMELLGGLLGYALIRGLYPNTAGVAAEAVAQTSTKGATMSDKPTVLFVCVHNAGRSQMAAGWLRHLAGDRIEIWSAGSEAADRVNPVAIEAMREVGIDISAETPKVLTTESVSRADVVITMGCGDTCPYVPGKRYLDWELIDPAGQGIEIVREVRDDIKSRIETLMSELLAAA
jgi:arsenate reductase